MTNHYIQQDTRLINLFSNSATCLNGSLKSSVSFNFKNLLVDEPNIIYSTIGIASAQIPVSYYTINEFNRILVTNLGSIDLTNGNYSSSTIIAEMTPKLVSLGFTNMVITISKQTGKLTFNSLGINFSFFSTGSTIFDILGFADTSYTSVEGIISAPFPLNLLGIQQLRITSNAFSSYNSSSSSLGECNLVSIIQSTAPPFGMILYNNINSFSVLKNKSISLIDIQILDEYGNLVDFNNTDWSMTFQLTNYRNFFYRDPTAAFLNPILTTLNKIEESLANNKTTENPSVDDTLENKDNTIEENIQNGEDDSLDLLVYNGTF